MKHVKKNVSFPVFVFVLPCLLCAPAARAERGDFTASLAVPVYKSYVRMRGFSPRELCVHSIGQSHIDAAWKWRLAETHQKVYRTFDQAVRHMELYPEFTFSQSQPAFYEWILEEHPELFKKMVEMEKRGQWIITGGMWVEPDGMMPDGESYVRQRLIGQRFYLEHFGRISGFAWLPDTFGYNPNLPQITARSGAKYMWAKKMTTNFETVFPFHNFYWRSPDGSEVLTTLNPFAVGLEFFVHGELGKFKDTRYLLKPGARRWFDYSVPPSEIEAALSDDWLYVIANFYGEGDGDQGPTPLEVKIQRRLAAKGLTEFSTPGEFYSRLEGQADRLPVWTDELYLERHRGTLTTHAWVKRANRLAESLMRAAEPLRSLLSLFGTGYPRDALEGVWKLICLNQFHDILPGSSIPEVYQDARVHYDRIHGDARGLIRSGMESLASMVRAEPPVKGAEAVLVWNPLGWERGGLARVESPGQGAYKVLDRRGEQVACDRWDAEIVFRAKQVPSMGYKLYYLEKGKPASTEELAVTKSADSFLLENAFVLVKVDRRTGHITSLVRKASGRDLISGPSNRIMAFHDRHKEHRAWNIQADYLEHPIPVPREAEVELTTGALFAEVAARRELEQEGRTTTFTQRVRLAPGDPLVYIDLDSEFHMHNALVKLEFNTSLQSDTVWADGAYLAVGRPTDPRTPAQKARWETACQKWMDLSDGEDGLALLNNGKHGFSLTPDGRGYRLTVIKGAEYPQAYSDAVNVRHYKKGELPYTDQGPHHVELALLAHPGDWRKARLWEAGYEFNTPLVAQAGAGGGGLPSQGSLLALESATSYIGSVKLAEDDNSLVVRLVEAAGESGPARIRLGMGLEIHEAWETDLLELDPRALRSSGASVSINMGPWQIRTIKIRAGL